MSYNELNIDCNYSFLYYQLKIKAIKCQDKLGCYTLC